MIADAIASQREFFDLLAEFFTRATGSRTPDEFAMSGRAFDDRGRREAYTLGPRHLEAANWFYPEIAEFYDRVGKSTFGEAKQLGGLKFVVGGSSEFRDSHFDGVRNALLYADTVLIPDPILPWIESVRSEEKFRDVLLLRQAFSLLRLRPLVEADVAYPAVFVFQSWEKTLQDHDRQTIDGIFQLTAGIVGSHIGCDFESFDDLTRYAASHTETFLTAVESANLFLAPGAHTGREPLASHISRYMDEIRARRTSEHVKLLEQLSPAQLVINGIYERLAHQYHLMENSTELAANPLLCVPQQWHYHELCARATHHELARQGVISEEAVQAIRALTSPGLSWLSEVGVADLVAIREANENEQFRRKLDAAISELHDVDISRLDRVVSQTSHAIASLIAQHNVEVRATAARYRNKHVQTLAAAAVTGTVLFAPVLGPFIGAGAPLAALGKYLWDKYNERQELKRATSSLMGVLATAARGA